MINRLHVLGIGPEGETLYRQVLRSPGLLLTTYANRLGWSDAEADRALEQLRRRRLVRANDLGEVRVDHPRAALERVVSAEEAQLATRRQDLARLRDAIDGYAADHRVGQQGAAADEPARERIDPASLATVHEQLAVSTDGPILVAHHADGLLPEDLPVVRRLLEEGREQRGVFLGDVAQDASDYVQAWADSGESQRLSPPFPSPFVCFGTQAALASTGWGKTTDEHVILRDPVAVRAFVELFERLWAAGSPVDRSDHGDDQLVELMRQGLKDEAIARLLGISLRTVRRRVARLMDDYSVGTRFQLALRIADRRSPGDT
ncbi:helix-turn-helix domain-containing protein [Demetria terragena]|uniref:helix-turn-helix domain-containing protein n=1 Tax=Demetria terragena TaxID=63959 RepID=UPI00035EB760|nr:helix-turn-helix domain-containing protein [Demetria terragena]